MCDLTIAYELVGQKEKAIESYAKAGLWRECLNVAYSIPMTGLEIEQLATQLAEDLLERRQFMDGARIYIDYIDNSRSIEQAVTVLMKGYQFSEAIRVVCFIPPHLRPGQR